MDENSNFQSLRDLSPEQRRAEVEWMKQELEWIEMRRQETIRKMNVLKEKVTTLRQLDEK